jgi:hypothetical protein
MSGNPDFLEGRKANPWERILAISTAVCALGALLAILVTVFLANGQIKEGRATVAAQLKETRDEAKVQHLVDETVRFDQPPLALSRVGLAKQRLDEKHKSVLPLDAENPPTEMWDVLNECDHVGLLTRRGYLDVEDVYSELGYWLLNFYADAEPAVLADRKEYPNSESDCTWLIEQMKPLEIKYDAGRSLRLTKEDLYWFYEEELHTQVGKPLPRSPRADKP